jgi:hypothetical protein
MKKSVLLLFVMVATRIISAQAQGGVVISSAPGWHKIGEKTASFNMESESIMVMGEDKFKALKLKVADAPINILSIDIYFESGDVQPVILKSQLKAGEETREIAISGGGRQLKKVVFVYKTMPKSENEKALNSEKENALVELYGLK